MNHAGTNGTPEPRTQSQAEDALTGRPLTLGYRPAAASWLYGGQGGGGRFGDLWAHLRDIERMVAHPDVILPYGYYKSGISDVEFRVKAAKPAQAQEAHAILSKFWEAHLDQAQLCYDYGWCGYEVAYRVEGGRLRFDGLYDLLPLDCWALTRRGRYVGLRLSGSAGFTPGNLGAGSADLWGPGRWPGKGLWLTHDRRWDRFHGRSQLRGAWRPWKRLAGVDGAEDISDGCAYRRGYQGPVVYYPPEDFKRKDSGELDYDAARDESRRIAEQAKAGFSIALPNAMIPGTSQRKWSIEWPNSSLENLGPLAEREGSLQVSISKGVGVPPELFEASETGSGWSGRKVPLLGFYVGQRKNARNLVRQVVRQLVLPILKWNHGPEAWVEVEAEVKLPEAIAGEPPPGQNPPVPTGGALPQPPGQGPPGQGQEPEQPDPFGPDNPLSMLMDDGEGGAELSLAVDDEPPADDWLDPGWYPEDDVDAWSEPLEYELAAGSIAQRVTQRQITKGPRQGQTGWYDPVERKFMPPNWSPQNPTQRRSATLSPTPQQKQAGVSAYNAPPAATKPAGGAGAAGAFGKASAQTPIAGVNRKGAKLDTSAAPQAAPAAGAGQRQVAVIPKAKADDFRRIVDATKKDIGEPSHPLHTDEGKAQLKKANFGAGTVKTITGKLAAAGHEAMDRMHSRAAAALQMAGKSQEAKAQQQAAQFHRDQAGRGAAAPAPAPAATPVAKPAPTPAPPPPAAPAARPAPAPPAAKPAPAAPPSRGEQVGKDFKDAFRTMGGGAVSAQFHAAAYDAYKNGGTKVAGIDEPSLQVAAVLKKNGVTLAPDQLKDLFEDTQAARSSAGGGPELQKALQGITQKWYDAAQKAAPPPAAPAVPPTPTPAPTPAAKAPPPPLPPYLRTPTPHVPPPPPGWKPEMMNLTSAGARKAAAQELLNTRQAKDVDDAMRKGGAVANYVDDYSLSLPNVKKRLVGSLRGKPLERAMAEVEKNAAEIDRMHRERMGAHDYGAHDAGTPTQHTLSALPPEPSGPDEALDALAGPIRTLARQARAALLRSLSEHHMGAALVAAQQWAAEWTPKLAAMSSLSSLSGSLSGMASLAAELESPGDAATPPWAEGAGEELPLVRASLESLASRRLIALPRWLEMQGEADALGQALAAEQVAHVQNKVREALAEALRAGETLDDFKKRLAEPLDAGGVLSPAQAENVFRTNVMAAYSGGQERLLADPAVGGLFPFRSFSATHDDRVRPEHLEMERRGIQGTNIYLADDPVWQIWRPPADYQCRCVGSPVSVAEAARRGIAYAQEWQRTGREPLQKAWVPVPPFSPSPGFDRGAELSAIDPEDIDSWSEPTGYELAGPEASRYQQRKVTRGPRAGQVGWYDTQGRKFMPADWSPSRGEGGPTPAKEVPKKPEFAPAKAPPKKLTVDQIHGAIQKLRAMPDKRLSPQGVIDMGRAIGTLTAAEVGELRSRLGMAKGRGAKQAKVDELVAMVTGGASGLKKPAPQPAKAGEKKPAALPPLKEPEGARHLNVDRARNAFSAGVGEGVLAACANAVPGAEVTWFAHKSVTTGVSAMADVEHEGVKARRVFKRARGVVVCCNASFHIDEDSPHKGAGYLILANQVQALRAAGVSRIETSAAGGPADPTHNGYYTWPRLGYSCDLSKEDRIEPDGRDGEGSAYDAIPPGMRKQMRGKDVLDLFDVPGGKEWWKANGQAIEMAFDLSDGSRSLKVLEGYVRERQERGREAD